MSVPLHVPMRPRDPREAYRVATPMELFFDLAVVVAVSAAAGQLHHAASTGHLAHGVTGFASVFFGVWWAWVNFTWFSSAFDTDDLGMRLMTMVQMAGVLVLAAGVPRAFDEGDYSVVVAGYVVMRVALVAQWLRARHETGDPDGTCLRYAAGVLAVQVYWVARLLVHGAWSGPLLVLGFLLEMLVPVVAERRGTGTSWHPGHIADRYGAFVIIVCGEVILSATSSFSAAATGGLNAQLLLVAVGAVLVVFTLWSFYFHRDHAGGIVERGPWLWAYLHFLVFASVAAAGAGIGVMVDVATGEAHVAAGRADLLLAGSLVVFLLALGLSSFALTGYRHELAITVAIAALVAVVGLLGRSPGVTTLLLGLVLVGSLVANAVVATRLYGRDGEGARP